MMRKAAMALGFLFCALLSLNTTVSPRHSVALSQPVNLEIVSGPTLAINPHGLSPLAGLLELEANVPVRVTLDVRGLDASWTVVFPDFAIAPRVHVLSLKANSIYEVDVTVTDETGASLAVAPTLQAKTGSFPTRFPIIEVHVSQPEKMAPGYILVDQSGGFTIILDSAGEVVWYSRTGDTVTRRLPNGRLSFFERDPTTNSRQPFEMDMLGVPEQVVELQNPGTHLHHDIFRTAHGTWLSLTSEVVAIPNYPTSTTDPNAPRAPAAIEDQYPVEFLADGTVLHRWPLTELLDPTRIGYNSLNNSMRGSKGWVHSNAVIHDPRDDSFIVSSRNQNAVVKIDRQSGALKWILGDHANWGPAFQPFLLTPVGQPFEWQYAQHAIMITPSGTLGLFDNGNHRASPFDGKVPVPGAENYSRAVEFDINEETMEVRQGWAYGADAEVILYTGSLSDADWLTPTDHVLITFGNVGFTDAVNTLDLGRSTGYGRVVEVTHETPAERVFDVSIYRTDVNDRKVIYRSEKIPSLYPDGVIVTHHTAVTESSCHGCAGR